MPSCGQQAATCLLTYIHSYWIPYRSGSIPGPSLSSPPRPRPLLIMASTTSFPEPTFTKPITSMTLAELRQTCQFFELPQTGITPTIRNRLRNFLAAHKQEMQHDYDYVALYPNRDPLPNRDQPADDAQDSQTFSQWNGIRGGRPASPNPS